jgi:hypothetical protein
MTNFVCQPLAKHHDRSSFRCGVTELDDYLIYARYGFQGIAGKPERMFLPMKTVADLLATDD